MRSIFSHILDTIVKLTNKSDNQIKFNMQVGQLRFQRKELTFEQPHTNFADLTTMLSKSKASTLKTRKFSKAMESKTEKESDFKAAIDILKNHKLSSKKAAADG